MGEKRSLEFKLSVVRRLQEGCRVTDVERETGVFRAQIYRWRRALERGGEAGLARGPGRRQGEARPRRRHGATCTGEPALAAPEPAAAPPEPAAPPCEAALQALPVGLRAWVAGLERTVARQQLELDFFKQALQHIEEARRSKTQAGAPASTPPSGP